MKKILFAFGLIYMLMSASAVYARVAGFGLTAGMNISKIDWKDVEGSFDPEPEKGWYAGITGMFSIPVLGFGFDGSVVYSQEPVNLGIEDMKEQKMHMVSVPVHLRYDFRYPVMEDVFVPYLYAGPQFNYSLNNLNFGDYQGRSLEAILKNSNAWRLDFGVGFTIMDHVQCSYSYGIPMGEKVDVNIGETILGNYQTGAHRIGLTYYF